MVSIIIFFILTVLKVDIVVVQTMSNFTLKVDELMTPEEISQTFGTDGNSVPDYQLISIKLPTWRRRFEDNATIYFKVEIDDTEINLIFKPTAGLLATKYTPVWSAVTDKIAYNKIRYDPLPNAMTEIGDFKMYHDVDNNAAIVIYADSDHDSIIEGIVTSNYAIKSLPIRLIDQTLKVGDNHFIESPSRGKRSIELDADEIISYCVLFTSPPPPENALRYEYGRLQKRHSQNITRNRPEAVYPEILLVLDHNAIRSHTITQALRFMLAFWNGADMVYSTLDDPKVYLNIAGIIISADDAATPYITEDTSIRIMALSNYTLSRYGSYFGTELVRFPLDQYDVMVAMTPIILCVSKVNPCDRVLGYATVNSACTPEIYAKRTKRIRGVGVVHYNWMFGGVDTAVHESAHFFNVRHDTGEGDAAGCNETEGYVMAPKAISTGQSLKWSPCSVRFIRNYFSSVNSQCLDNVPNSIRPVKEVLPGRWLTLDGQCQNDGFERGCRIPAWPLCTVTGCRAFNSSECEISRYIPLEGTKCGENKRCKIGTGCIDD